MDEEIQAPAETSESTPAASQPGRITADAVLQAFADTEEREAAPAPSETPATAETTEQPAGEAEPAMVPSHRLREETEKRRQVEERLGPWAETLEHLGSLGVTPAELQAFLAGQAPGQTQQPAAPATQQPAGTPEQQFEEALSAQGIDPAELEFSDYQREFRLWKLEQSLAAQEQARQTEVRQATERALVAQWQADVQAVQGEFEELKDPFLMQSLVNHYEAQHGIQPNLAQFRALAGNLRKSIQSLTQAQIQQYAAGKKQDERVPVTAGGASPAPVERPDFHSMSPEERKRAMASTAEALFAAP